MEIKGEDFIKNVQIKREQTELEERLMELESQARNINSNSSSNPYEKNNPYSSNSFTYEEEVNKTESELDDILLGANTGSQNKDNKKKYIILGLVLAVLFLITIIIFRLLDNETKIDDSLTTNQETIPQDKPLGDNIEQQYQKIVNEKLKSIEALNKKTEEQKKELTESMDLNNIQKEETKVALPTPSSEELEKAKELKKDIFNVEEKVVEPKPVVTKPTPKPTPKPVVKQEVAKPIVTNTGFAKAATSKPSGTFIQVGAFSKTIDKDYMDNLKNSNLNYVFYKVDVKGTTFTKVLVGPYNSRNDATKDINTVKAKLKIQSVFILKL